MPPQSNPHQLLKPDEVADLIGVSTRTLWNWEAAGRIPPPIRFNLKVVRWPAADIRLWIDCHLDMVLYKKARETHSLRY